MKDPAVVSAIEKAGLVVEYHGPEDDGEADPA